MTILQEKLVKDYRTSLQKPEDYAETLRAHFLLKNIFLPMDVAKCIEEIQMQDLKVRRLLLHLYCPRTWSSFSVITFPWPIHKPIN